MSTTTNNTKEEITVENITVTEKITKTVIEGTEQSEEPFKTVSSINEKFMTKRLMDRIREDFGTNPVVFLKQLTDNDAYIVGQFILETIHNERYLGNPITMTIIRYFDIEKNDGTNDPLVKYLRSISNDFPASSTMEKNKNNIVHDFSSFKAQKKIRLILKKRETNSPRIPMMDNNFVSIFNCSFGGINHAFDSGRSVLFPINDLSFKLDDWTDIKNKAAVFWIPSNFDLKNKMNLKRILDDHAFYFSNHSQSDWSKYKFRISSETNKKIWDAFSDVIDTCGLYARKDYDGILKLLSTVISSTEQRIKYNSNPSNNHKKYSFTYGDSHLFWEHETIDGLFGLIFDYCKHDVIRNNNTIHFIPCFLGKNWYEL